MTIRTLCYILFWIILIYFNTSIVIAQTGTCNAFELNLPNKFNIGKSAFNFASGDINSDGIPDLVAPTPNSNSGELIVLKGDGFGGFLPPISYVTDTNINVAAIGDLNNDNKPDVVAAYFGSNKVVVFINDGNGGFLTTFTIPLPNNIFGFYDLKIGDFNGDGNKDLVGVAGQSLNFFVGNGSGSVFLSTSLPWTATNSDIVVGNFNNDSFTDVVVTSGSSSSFYFSLVLGNTGNNFTMTNTFSLDGRPTGIDVDDFDLNGTLDLVFAVVNPFQPPSSFPPYFVQTWLSSGTGSFNPNLKVETQIHTGGITSGDFNSDGEKDLAVVFETGSARGPIIGTLDGRGGGSFSNPKLWTGSSISSILSFDTNQDNKRDLVTLTEAGNSSFVSVLLNKNNGDFNTSKVVLFGGTDLTAADLNNDGKKDFISGTDTDFSTADVVVALNDSNNGLLPDIGYQTPRDFRDLESGDFNGDGNQDVVSVHSSGTVQIAAYLGNGLGSLGSSIGTSFNASLENVIVGDFNVDGKDDVFVTSANGLGYSFLSNGNGTFTQAANSPVTTQSVGKLQKGDFNSDSKIDLIISGSGSTRLWLGNGQGQFTLSSSVIPSLNEVVVGDFNGDGMNDLAGFHNGGVTKILGDGTGIFNNQHTQTLTGSLSSLVSGDFNNDGISDVAFVSTNLQGNLVILPSLNIEPFWGSPIYFSPGNITYLIASDYDNNGKIDLGFMTRYQSRGVIYNLTGQSPCLSINDVSVTEGDSGMQSVNFSVTLSSVSNQDVRVNFTSNQQTATANTDFQNVSGRLRIPAGEVSGSFSIPIFGDVLDEFDETFTINLSSPLNAAIVKATGVGTILDNDAMPNLTITDVSQTEPNFTQGFIFRVNLSAPSGKPISFRYSTSDGTAIAGRDYLTVNNTWNIPVGTTFAEFSVFVQGDNVYEEDETFSLNISEANNVSLLDSQGQGKIINNDTIPTLSFFGNNIVEGDTGVRNLQLTLQLSNPTYLPVTLNLDTISGTATSNVDFVNLSNLLITIPPEQQTFSTNVQIISDTIPEVTEQFFVRIQNPSNAGVTNPQNQFFIFDDDSQLFDFDGDKKSDISVFRPSNGAWYIQRSQTGFYAVAFGQNGDKIVPADFSGDGKTDVAIYRPTDNTWYVFNTANNTFYGIPFGTNGDIPVPEDFDGDGKADINVFRPSTGFWFRNNSSNGQFVATPFGQNGDVPTVGDYDGDGKADIGVWRPTNGAWYRLNSNNNSFFAVAFGQTGDKVVPADYTGDGKTDIAVYRAGTWYILRSEDLTFYGIPFGLATDIPSPGDFDGDGKADQAVYRDGQWYIQQSTNGFTTYPFGLTGDIPTHSAFVY